MFPLYLLFWFLGKDKPQGIYKMWLSESLLEDSRKLRFHTISVAKAKSAED